MSKSTKQLVRLKRFYKIKGDGVAQLNLADAVSDTEFKKTLVRMSQMRVEKAEETTEASEVLD